jgi:type I restriction enzyme S subunit
VYYQLASSDVQSAIRGMASTTTNISNVSTGKLRNLEIRIAPSPEQDRIVAEIDKQFTRLDAATAALKRVQANLKRYRASVLKAACEGRLVPTEAELARKEGRDYEPADHLLQRILRERRTRWEADTLAKMIASGKPPRDDRWKQKYKEPALPDTKNLPELPEGWRWASVEALSTKVVDGVHKKPNYVAAGIPFITVRNLTAGPGISFDQTNFVSVEDHAEFIKRTDPELGDVLISKDGTLGTVRAIRTDRVFSIFVSVAMIKPVIRTMTDFLEIAMMAPQVQSQMVPKGSGLQHIHLEDLRADCIPLPPLAEQARLSEECSRQLSLLDATEGQIPRFLHRLTSLRNSILAHAFSGKLVPQNHAEESASVLLDRIRAECTANVAPIARLTATRQMASRPLEICRG